MTTDGKPGTDCLLLIVARAPIPGITKTRLGATIGMERSAQLHRAFLTDLSARFGSLDGLEPRPFDMGWAFAPADYDFAAAMAELDPLAKERAILFVPQSGEDFAEVLMNLFRWACEHGYRRTQIMASDSPQLPAEVAPDGFRLLAENDVILGRVADGGYYLVGMRGVHEVISPEVMSTGDAASDLIAAARVRNLRVGELPPSFDIDVEADLEPLIAALRSDPSAAPGTWQALRELGLA